jgi:hypothetical protein
LQAVARSGPSCFDACPQPTNTSSTCWISCFYSTLMGPTSGMAPLSGDSGMPLTQLQQAFEAPFASSDPAHAGCPPV